MFWVNSAGILLIALIVWWFWLYKPKKMKTEGQSVTILVENGVYSPANIEVRAGEEIQLNFIRKDQSPCAELVIFPDLDLSESLPIGKPYRIKLPPLKAGSYPFHCQMQMYRGMVQVV